MKLEPLETEPQGVIGKTESPAPGVGDQKQEAGQSKDMTLTCMGVFRETEANVQISIDST